MGMAPMPAMGIQGPVAAGPVAGGSMPGLAPAAPIGEPSGGDRAQSYRVFAIVLGLVTMVMFGLLLTVVMLFAGFYMQDQKETPAAVPPPAAVPSRPNNRRVDTGVPAPQITAPKPTPKPKPRPSSGPKPSPRPAPAPAPPPTSPADVTVKIAAGMPYTSVEVTCPSGFRQRGSFAGGTATVPGVPREDCKAKFKGGPPASQRVSGGQTISCADQGGAIVCN